jgi:hypothetical protein
MIAGGLVDYYILCRADRAGEPDHIAGPCAHGFGFLEIFCHQRIRCFKDCVTSIQPGSGTKDPAPSSKRVLRRAGGTFLCPVIPEAGNGVKTICDCIVSALPAYSLMGGSTVFRISFRFIPGAATREGPGRGGWCRFPMSATVTGGPFRQKPRGYRSRTCRKVPLTCLFCNKGDQQGAEECQADSDKQEEVQDRVKDPGHDTQGACCPEGN